MRTPENVSPIINATTYYPVMYTRKISKPTPLFSHLSPHYNIGVFNIFSSHWKTVFATKILTL